MKVSVFIGPTISEQIASEYLTANYLPPAAQGDVFAEVKNSPDILAIIDGYFHNVPSVWHKEILWAMSKGIHVFGCSSMGALRAAELDAFGMVGIGEIYKDYRDGILMNDDEVAVTHGPQELGYPALSEALTNIRSTLAHASREKVINKDTHDQLIKIAEDTFFPKRTYKNIIAIGREKRLAAMDSLDEWLPENQINRKRNDAVDMLKHISEFIDTKPEKMQVPYHVETTYLFDDHV